MKLPLFISAKPFAGQHSMKVIIGPGDWTINNNDSESILDFYVDDVQISGPIITVDRISKVHAVVVSSKSSNLFVSVGED